MNLKRERLIEEYFILPDNLKDAGFKNYQILDGVKAQAKEATIKYTKDFLSGEYYNLLLLGNPGTGKTHLCSAIARTLKENGVIVGFLTTGELLRKIKATYNKGSSKAENDIFKDLKQIELLILDDLGAESLNQNNEWYLKTMFEIVNSRLGIPTIYTSNFDDQKLPIAVGERVFSRLYDNTKFVDLFTEDYRKKLKIE